VQSECSIAEAYEILELPQGASLEKAEDAYRSLTMQVHPDRFQNNSKMRSHAEDEQRKLNDAIRVLRLHWKASKSNRDEQPRRPKAAPPTAQRQEPPSPPATPPPPSSSPRPKSARTLWVLFGWAGLGKQVVIGEIATFVFITILIALFVGYQRKETNGREQNVVTSLQDVVLSSDVKIIETVDLNVVAEKPREMVLWMQTPKRVVRDPNDSWTCANAVYGDDWVGRTRLSLFDSARGTLINTVEIVGQDGNPGFSLPFLVSSDYYHVPSLNSKNEGKPKILSLRDLTGEGVAADFVLFEYEACGIASTSVLGYSRQSDRAVQYPVEVVQSGQEPKTGVWVTQIFRKEPMRPGYWDFTWDPGHGADAKLHEQVSFDPGRQLFVDRHEIIPDPDN
jgi:curved DNA-binding protein CbpA